MGFLRSSLQLIDFLAWPVLALGYPICASIRAIETGSKYHMRKLVIYWTIFSFISLFELLFQKLIQWIPLWPYIKLITISLLVIPQFNRASHFYQNIINPRLLVKLHQVVTQFYGSCSVYPRFLFLCLTINLQNVTNWFNKPMEDPSLKNETFLDVAEMFLEENGCDALEKLIENKSKDYSLNHYAKEIKITDTRDNAVILTPNQTVSEGVGPVWEDIKVMDYMIKHEAAEANQVKSGKENLIQIEKKTTRMQIKQIVVPADTKEIKPPEITSLKQVQTQWTCALCHVTTTSEKILKSHLNGRKHKAKCIGPETCKQMPKSEGIPYLTAKSIQLNQEQVKHAAAVRPDHSTNEAAHKQDKSVNISSVQIEKKTAGLQVKKIELPAATEQIKMNSSKQVEKEWSCAVCQVTTTSEHDLKCHLHGKRHREMCVELKKKAKTERNISNQLKQEEVKHVRKQSSKGSEVKKDPKLWCSFCNISCPCQIAMAAHINGRKHLAKLQEK